MDVQSIVLEELDVVARSLGRTFRHASIDDLKEIAFEAAVAVMRSYCPEKGDLRAYARLRMGGEIVQYFRTEARRFHLLADSYAAQPAWDQGPSPEDVVVARDLVAKLEGVEREVVLRRFWGDEDLDDIASSVGRNKSWSTRTMRRAMERMAA
jgi:DNA-directed RNA polymerase specialized sigma24 family protein